jgi:hypothetical protein
MRRNKEIVEHIVQESPISTSDKIFNFIAVAKDGLTFSEIYRKMPKMSPRNIREHIQKLKNNDRLRLEACRCHSSTVYYIR